MSSASFRTAANSFGRGSSHVHGKLLAAGGAGVGVGVGSAVTYAIQELLADENKQINFSNPDIEVAVDTIFPIKLCLPSNELQGGQLDSLLRRTLKCFGNPECCAEIRFCTQALMKKREVSIGGPQVNLQCTNCDVPVCAKSSINTTELVAGLFPVRLSHRDFQIAIRPEDFHSEIIIQKIKRLTRLNFDDICFKSRNRQMKSLHDNCDLTELLIISAQCINKLGCFVGLEFC
ncbi:hypothetical protein niasHS_008979 [Heterodera schachtii]|uniref:Uncharacterized protein n=1 Tax=Heterodera schachtii TaxID=97005 RepID=A0ABD2J4J8_HETSC